MLKGMLLTPVVGMETATRPAAGPNVAVAVKVAGLVDDPTTLAESPCVPDTVPSVHDVNVATPCALVVTVTLVLDVTPFDTIAPAACPVNSPPPPGPALP